jgi:hypothetical protein
LVQVALSESRADRTEHDAQKRQADQEEAFHSNPCYNAGDVCVKVREQMPAPSWTDTSEGRTLPSFVTDGLHDFLGCGILARGLAQLF